MGRIINSYKTFVKKPEGKRLLGRHRRRWEDNIKMDLRESEDMWTERIWLRIGTSNRLANTVMNLHFP
jgi:hypothetical protein